MTVYHIGGINPEPWTSPSGVKIGKSVRMFKKAKLVNFQKALNTEFARLYPEVTPYPKNARLDLEMWFWRTTSGGGKPADATNLLKAAEDALAGLLYENDRSNISVHSHIIAQNKDVDSPGIRIAINEIDGAHSPLLPQPDVEPAAEPAPSETDDRWADQDVDF